MRDKALYIIIGVLLGVVIMQAKQGPQPAQAQEPAAVSGYVPIRSYNTSTVWQHYAYLSNGDIYRVRESDLGAAPEYVGNFWGDPPPVPVSNESWGASKARYDDGKK